MMLFAKAVSDIMLLSEPLSVPLQSLMNQT